MFKTTVWTVHFIDIIALSSPWWVLLYWIASVLWNALVHYVLERPGSAGLVCGPNFNKILRRKSSRLTVPERLPSLKILLNPDHFVFTSSVTLPFSSVDHVGLGTKLCIALKDLFVMTVGQAVLYFFAPHSSHDLVRDSNYHCYIESSDPVDLNTPVLEFQSAAWKLTIPQCYSLLDYIGFGILIAYMSFLVLYCILTQCWTERCVNFSTEVTMRIFYRLGPNKFVGGDLKDQFAELMGLSVTEFQKMLLGSELQNPVTDRTRLVAPISSYEDSNERSDIGSDYPTAFQELYESLKVEGKRLFSSRLLIKLNSKEVTLEEALKEISASEATEGQNETSAGAIDVPGSSAGTVSIGGFTETIQSDSIPAALRRRPRGGGTFSHE